MAFTKVNEIDFRNRVSDADKAKAGEAWAVFSNHVLKAIEDEAAEIFVQMDEKLGFDAGLLFQYWVADLIDEIDWKRARDFREEAEYAYNEANN